MSSYVVNHGERNSSAEKLNQSVSIFEYWIATLSAFSEEAEVPSWNGITSELGLVLRL